MADGPVLCWGVIGCGNISHDFSLAVSRLQSPRHRLVATASKSSLENAENFAKRFNMKRWYDSYEQLLADPEINAIYIGNLHPGHKQVALAAIEAGKAALVEKPLTMTVADSQQLLEASQTKGVLLVEGVWSRFTPAYARIRQLMSGQNALKPALVIANFTDAIDHKNRVTRPELGGGAMLDIGIYGVQLSTMVFGGAAPTKICATGHANEFGVDVAECVSLEYASGGHASITVDIRCGNPSICEARIIFHKGGEYSSVKLCAPFWATQRLELVRADGSIVVEEIPIYPNAATDDGLKFFHCNSQALAYEAEGFADAFQQWQASRGSSAVVVDHAYRSHKDTLTDAKIMETVISEITTNYA